MIGLTFELMDRETTSLGWKYVKVLDRVILRTLERKSVRECCNEETYVTVYEYYLCCLCTKEDASNEYVEINSDEFYDEIMNGIYTLCQ